MNGKEDNETSYLQFDAILMARKSMHTQTHSINKDVDSSDLCLVNWITWELPRSTQPWPGTIPSFNLDPPQVGSNMQVA